MIVDGIHFCAMEVSQVAKVGCFSFKVIKKHTNMASKIATIECRHIFDVGPILEIGLFLI